VKHDHDVISPAPKDNGLFADKRIRQDRIAKLKFMNLSLVTRRHRLRERCRGVELAALLTLIHQQKIGIRRIPSMFTGDIDDGANVTAV
jgi:hypothetical protein